MISREIEVVSVNISAAKGTPKRPVPRVVLDERGVLGDAHAGEWHRQVSVLGEESVREFSRRTGVEVRPGEFAENLTVRGLEGVTVRLLDRLHLGEVELEVTQIGKECHGEGCAIFQQVGECLMPKEGVFCRVLRGGELRPGTRGTFAAKVWRFRIITLSDRASRGVYPDRSGRRLRELLEEYLTKLGWPAEIESVVLADEAEALRTELAGAREGGVDVVLSTGGTGVGPRDIAPETVAGFCDRLVPGIMEGIRAKFGPGNPRAWLSRAVVGMAGDMAVYTLPGSVRAVEEYMGEIVKTMDHLLYMARGVGH